MRKIFTLISTLVLGITVLTGCANASDKSHSTDNTSIIAKELIFHFGHGF